MGGIAVGMLKCLENVGRNDPRVRSPFRPLMENEIHHYSPRWLMKNWADDNSLICFYDKSKNKIFKTGLKNLASQANFNKCDLLGINLERPFFENFDRYISKAYEDAVNLAIIQILTRKKRISDCVFSALIDIAIRLGIRSICTRDQIKNKTQNEMLVYFNQNGIMKWTKKDDVP